MATITLNFDTTNEGGSVGVTSMTVNASNTPVELVTINRGDTVRFRWRSHIGPAIDRLGVFNLPSAVFVNNASFFTLTSTPSQEDRVTRTNTAFGDYTFSTNQRALGVSFNAQNWTIRVLNPNDNTPDSFSFRNLSGVAPGIDVIQAVTITGINVATNVSLTNTARFSFKINNGAWRTSPTTITNGQVLYIRCSTPPTFSVTNTTTVTVGTLSRSWSVTTGNAASAPFIPIGISALPISFSQVSGFFGSVRAQPLLSDYLRSGQLVPNITQNQNAGITEALPLNLSSFVNSGTSLFFKEPPQGQSASFNSLSASTTLTLNWAANGVGDGRFVMGFSTFAGIVQFRYRWSYTIQTVFGNVGTPQLLINGSASVPNGGMSSWSTTNLSAEIRWFIGSNSEAFVQGTLFVDARHPNNLAQPVVFEVPFSLVTFSL